MDGSLDFLAGWIRVCQGRGSHATAHIEGQQVAETECISSTPRGSRVKLGTLDEAGPAEFFLSTDAMCGRSCAVASREKWLLTMHGGFRSDLLHRIDEAFHAARPSAGGTERNDTGSWRLRRDAPLYLWSDDTAQALDLVRIEKTPSRVVHPDCLTDVCREITEGHRKQRIRQLTREDRVRWLRNQHSGGSA